MKKIKQTRLFLIVKCLFGKHEWECSDIHNGTMHDLSSWCKNCGCGWKP